MVLEVAVNERASKRLRERLEQILLLSTGYEAVQPRGTATRRRGSGKLSRAKSTPSPQRIVTQQEEAGCPT
jgi:hypothetical protein